MNPATTTQITETVSELRNAYAIGRTRDKSWRHQQLEQLAALLELEEKRLLHALASDLSKPAVEAYGGEIAFLKTEIKHTLRHLSKWMKPQRVHTPVLNFWGSSRVHREPLGVVCIIGPWNYPIQLVLSPLIGAIAAGNCALLKPSELTPHSSQLLADLLPQYLDSDCVNVIQGGVAETTEILEQRFDHIFFTGSTRVGKIVMQAAARHLTPVTLELGGKSPAIVDEECDLSVAARRITWGKYFNAGQTCVAPDYVLVHRSQEQPLLDSLQRTLHEFYGQDPKQSPDLARIVSESHHDRLVEFLKDGQIIVGGEHNREELYFAPTILTNVAQETPVMSEEIFGPVLPVLSVDSIDEAIGFVNARPKPLALYVFSTNSQSSHNVLEQTSSGGACVNDTVSQLVPPDLPFGGVGESGMGAYHGRESFETFSHRKSVFSRANWPDLKLRYPPYKNALAWIKRLMA